MGAGGQDVMMLMGQKMEKNCHFMSKSNATKARMHTHTKQNTPVRMIQAVDDESKGLQS